MKQAITTTKDKGKRAVSKKASSKPVFKLCPVSGEKVWITTVTCADIKNAQKNGDVSMAKKKNLVRIPSKLTREKCYEDAARAIEDKEQQILPTYGGRPWRVICRFTEPNTNQKPPLFRWFRGELELAVLPHFLAKIPNPIETRGMARLEEENEEGFYNVSTDLCERTESQLSRIAWSDREHKIPTMSLKWLSPNHDRFSSRKAAEEEANKLMEQQLFVDKIVFGYGVRGQKLQPRIHSKNDALLAGKWRFLRDGIWIVGQEESWQKVRAIEMDEERVQQKIEQQQKREKPKKPLVVPKTPLELFVKTQRNAYQAFMLRKLQGIMDKPQFPLTVADRELRNIWKNEMSIEEKQNWKDLFLGKKPCFLSTFELDEPIEIDPFESQVSTCAESQMEGNPFVQSTIASDQVDRIDLTSSATSFPVGKEPNHPHGKVWIPSTLQNSDAGAKLATNRSIQVNHESIVDRDFACATLGNKDALNDANSSSAEYFQRTSIRNEAEALNLGSMESIEIVRANVISPGDSEEEVDEQNRSHLGSTRSGMRTNEYDPFASHIIGDDECVNETVCSQRRAGSMSNIQSESDVRRSTRPQKKRCFFDEEKERKAGESKKVHTPSVWAVPAVQVAHRSISPLSSIKPTAEETKPPEPLMEKRSASRQMQAPMKTAQSEHWRLSRGQIMQCYDATMEHFEKVMHTVRARALFAELADGFDLLRERGRGRYDMELPAFDEPAFAFLTDFGITPWMSIVKQILGNDVVLIHKGVFLSNPGADAQEYHQDGPHLTTQYQRPCHAINVFIPLVDLTSRNGPTEFVAGSHILDFDHYDRKKAVIPLVKAGTPIIFDYRLGHRGLANSSNECRPIVYCTYAAAANGKEFRDSVNFSRKRYHRLGEMVDKPLSRSERCKLRRLVEEQQSSVDSVKDVGTRISSKVSETGGSAI